MEGCPFRDDLVDEDIDDDDNNDDDDDDDGQGKTDVHETEGD